MISCLRIKLRLSKITLSRITLLLAANGASSNFYLPDYKFTRFVLGAKYEVDEGQAKTVHTSTIQSVIDVAYKRVGLANRRDGSRLRLIRG